MGGFRYRHVIANGGPEGERSAWIADSTPMPLDVADSGTGALVYVAPLWSPYDTLGTNPDGPPGQGSSTPNPNIQTLLGIYVVSDLTVAAASVASDISFQLYRAGAAVGGGRIAGWNSGANPLFTVGVPVFVPFNASNTALMPVPSVAGAQAVSTTQALLPMQPGDSIICTATTRADLVNLYGFVNAQ